MTDATENGGHAYQESPGQKHSPKEQFFTKDEGQTRGNREWIQDESTKYSRLMPTPLPLRERIRGSSSSGELTNRGPQIE
jgi:hypothetical protein